MNAGNNQLVQLSVYLTLPPIEDMNVIAKLVAIVIRVGICKTVNIIGTSRNPPAAPTIPDPIPTINAKMAANSLLNVT